MRKEETYVIKFFPVGKGEWAVKLQSVKGQEIVRFSTYEALTAFLDERYRERKSKKTKRTSSTKK
jgi:hypothetical protein